MRRQCRRFEFQRSLLPVRMRIHWGMGRFWAIFFASVRFVRKVLCDGCEGARRVRRRGRRGAWASLGIVCVFLLRALTVVRGGRRGRRPELAFQASVGPPVRRALLRRAQERGFVHQRLCVCCGEAPGSRVRSRGGPGAAPRPSRGAQAKELLRDAAGQF